MQGYDYKPLDHAQKEIRLLHVKQHLNLSDGGNLEFEVATLSLNSAAIRTYYALSYVWGNDPKPVEINLDGETVNVPDSSELALRQVLRALKHHGHTFEYFWIDAICINQSDLTEKSVQVALMAEIYAAADAVYAWLGDSNGDVEAEVNMLELLRDQCHAWTNDGKDFEFGNADQIQVHKELPVPVDFDFDALAAFCESKWFSRLWILQEAMLAKALFIVRGRLLIPWDLVSIALRWLEHRRLRYQGNNIGGEAKYAAATNFTTIVEESLGPNRAFLGLYMMLLASTYAQTSNPWDRIYALLGLITGGRTDKPPPIIPDYNKPLKELYAHATRVAIEEAGDMYMLCFLPYSGHHGLENWPSWVPRFDQELVQDVWITRHSLGNDLDSDDDDDRADDDASANASAGTRFDRELMLGIGGDPCVLQLRGVRYALIESIMFSLAPIDGSGSYPWSRQLVESVALETEGSILKLGDALTGGSYGIHRNVANRDRLAADFGAFLLRTKNRLHLPSQPDLERSLSVADAHSGDADRFQQKVLVSEQNSLAGLKSGGFAIVQKAAEAGDWVCIVFGSRLPFVMRCAGEQWKMRGVTYVPGIMQVGLYVSDAERMELIECQEGIYTVAGE